MIEIGENELQFDYIRSAGPGGQNVNKVATAVQLRFDVFHSPSLEPEIKERLAKVAGSRMTDAGVLVIEAKRYRTQEQNRIDAIHRLQTLIEKAAKPPQERKATHPSASSQAARVAKKKQRGEVKRQRHLTPEDFE